MKRILIIALAAGLALMLSGCVSIGLGLGGAQTERMEITSKPY